MSGYVPDPNLYPQLSRGDSMPGFQVPNQDSSNNLNYYNPQEFGQPGASMLQGLGSAAFGPMGSHVLSSGTQFMNDNIGRFMTLSPLKYYFNVNNSYVMNKVRLLLCPFFHKSWKRRIVRVGEVDSYAFPREDINAPDLYIPTMAFVTYILLVGFVFGTTSTFTPEVLGLTASKGLATLVFEIMMIKTVFYLFNCGGVSLLDLSSYCGYKFVGLVAVVLSGLAVGGYLYFLFSIYIGIAMGFFMIRTLRLVLVQEASRVAMGPGMMGVGVPNNTAKNYFLVLIAGFQILLTYFLA